MGNIFGIIYQMVGIKQFFYCTISRKNLHNSNNPSPQTYLVLTTQGEYDEEALEEAVKTSCGYIAFVASRKKADAVFDF